MTFGHHNGVECVPLCGRRSHSSSSLVHAATTNPENGHFSGKITLRKREKKARAQAAARRAARVRPSDSRLSAARCMLNAPTISRPACSLPVHSLDEHVHSLVVLDRRDGSMYGLGHRLVACQPPHSFNEPFHFRAIAGGKYGIRADSA